MTGGDGHGHGGPRAAAAAARHATRAPARRGHASGSTAGSRQAADAVSARAGAGRRAGVGGRGCSHRGEGGAGSVRSAVGAAAGGGASRSERCVRRCAGRGAARGVLSPSPARGGDAAGVGHRERRGRAAAAGSRGRVQLCVHACLDATRLGARCHCARGSGWAHRDGIHTHCESVAPSLFFLFVVLPASLPGPSLLA